MGAQWISWPALIDAIGNDAAETLRNERGGLTVYVSETPENGVLARIVGVQAALALAHLYGCTTLAIPAAKGSSTVPEVVAMLQEGVRPSEIAKRCNITLRRVAQVKAMASRPKKKEKRKACQLSLPIKSLNCFTVSRLDPSGMEGEIKPDVGGENGQRDC